VSLLEVEGLCKRFGGLRAVREVGFAVEQGSIVALIGPNGAGKTTCFNLIAGVLRPDDGRIRFAGRSITGLPPERISRLGLLRTFQIPRPMGGMTVEENAMVAALAHGMNFDAARAAARDALARVGLAAHAARPAASLTLPERKMLELARCLAAGPRLLLLDEVMAGLRPAETDAVVEVLRAIRASGVTLLLVEHVMRAVMALAEKIVVLHHGEKIAEGPPPQVVADRRVIESYLGRGAAAS